MTVIMITSYPHAYIALSLLKLTKAVLLYHATSIPPLEILQQTHTHMLYMCALTALLLHLPFSEAALSYALYDTAGAWEAESEGEGHKDMT